MPNAVQAFFLPAVPGQRLALYHAPAGPTAKAALLYIHPWAEEMNKSRRMAAMTSRALAAAGHAVLQIDLHGCGDSSGDWPDASWASWVDDVLLGASWLRQRHADAPLWLWGHRAGALLAAQAARDLPADVGLLLWQPALAGKALLQQFLRLKAAAEMQGGDAKATLQHAREELAAGRSIEVAGYTLPGALAQGLEEAVLDLPHPAMQVIWLETTTRETPALLPASAARVEAWQAAGHRVEAQAVNGPAFWQTQEIEDAPALLAATVDAMSRCHATVPA